MADQLFQNLGNPVVPVTTPAPTPTPVAVVEPVVVVPTSASVPSAPVVAASSQPFGNADEEEVVDEIVKPDELTMLKSRAKMMGITHSNNISIEALRLKIKETIEGTSKVAEEKALEKAVNSQVNALASSANDAPVKSSKKLNLRSYMQKEKMKLIRLRITNLDPKKADLRGEIVTIANEYLGTVRKFIPFGEATDNGYHVPYCLYEYLRDKQFLSIKTRKDPRNGQTIVENQMVKEFSLDILPMLTSDELARISASQLSANSIDN